MGLGIPSLNIKIMLESNPLKSIMLVRRLAVHAATHVTATHRALNMSSHDMITYARIRLHTTVSAAISCSMVAQAPLVYKKSQDFAEITKCDTEHT